jgi:predicted phosphodiesterase
MIKLLKLLIWGHAHKWETREVQKLIVQNDGRHVATGQRVFVVCKTCGEPKKFDLA